MKKSQSGRSMVEMLGVLSIMGVLSFVGTAAYTTAMKKYRVNEILSGIRERALAISAYQGFNGGEANDLLEYQDKPLKGYSVALYDKRKEIAGTDFAIQIGKLNQEECEQVASTGLESSILIRPNLCDAAHDNIIIFGFKNTLEGRDDRRDKEGQLFDDPEKYNDPTDPFQSEACSAEEEGNIQCNGNISEKCQMNPAGNYFWYKKEMCLYGCSGGVCSTRDCMGKTQKCWDKRSLLVCENGQWKEQKITCLSECSNDQCGEDCSQSDASNPNKVACWGKGNFSEPAEVYSCKQDSNGRYTYSNLVSTCTDKNCDACMSAYLISLSSGT